MRQDWLVTCQCGLRSVQIFLQLILHLKIYFYSVLLWAKFLTLATGVWNTNNHFREHHLIIFCTDYQAGEPSNDIESQNFLLKKCICFRQQVLKTRTANSHCRVHHLTIVRYIACIENLWKILLLNVVGCQA